MVLQAIVWTLILLEEKIIFSQNTESTITSRGFFFPPSYRIPITRNVFDQFFCQLVKQNRYEITRNSIHLSIMSVKLLDPQTQGINSLQMMLLFVDTDKQTINLEIKIQLLL